MPYSPPHPDQLVTVWERNLKEGYDQNAPAAGNYLDWRARNRVFAGMAAYDGFRQFNLSGAERPERVPGTAASASLFPLLAVQPLMGRTFHPSEEQRGNDRVVVLSYDLWQQRFGGDREIVGKTLKVDGRACAVIGVTPAGFVFPGDTGTVGELSAAPAARLWMPLALDARTWAERSNHYLSVMARLKPAMSLDRAGAEMNVIEQQLVKQYPKEFMDSDVKMIPLQMQVAGTLKPVLVVLLGAVAFVLLIGCANVANLL